MTEKELNQTQERVKKFKVYQEEYLAVEDYAQKLVLRAEIIKEHNKENDNFSFGKIIVEKFLDPFGGKIDVLILREGGKTLPLHFNDELFNDFLNLLVRHSAALKAEMEAI